VDTFKAPSLLEEKTLSFEVAGEGSIEINVGLDTLREILPSGFLAILSSFAKSVDFFDPFLRHFSPLMKEVSYSIMDKIALFQEEEKVDVNVDATGLTVYGDRYQFARKGHFPKKRGRKGYQLSLGTTNSQYSQILSLILDPGNISLAARLWDTIYEVAEVLGSLERIGVIRRCPYPVRTVLTKAIDAKGKIEYRYIYTSFSPKEMDEAEVNISFRKRTDIQRIIRDGKYGLHIDNLYN